MGTSDFDLYKIFRGLKIDEDKDVNILLLGETGVGKSTFINALANYLTFRDLNRAKKEKLMILIPSQFYVTDKHKNYCKVEVGNDKNEYLETGESATQDVKTYIFPIGKERKTKLRIIDSPGLGDTRGIAQDNINCENILSYIGQLDELHAICLMFTPGNARVTAFFDYCFKEILSRLDKSASKNLVFIFTNTRAANYTAGDTLSLLRKIKTDIQKNPPHVDIPLESSNIFCFENDAFRYLAASKNGIEFSDEMKKDYVRAWNHSSMECWRMISYIIGDDNNKPLTPHSIKNTISINEARRLIKNLSQPLADISQLIQDNISVLESHRRDLGIETGSIEELKKKLYIPVISLQVTALTQPVTVCTSSKCAKFYKVGNANKWHYVQRCHDPCYLTNVQKEMIGDPGLVNCACIDRRTRSCIKCTCDFSIHMHVYYLTTTVDTKKEDEVIKKDVISREEALNVKRRIMSELEERMKNYEGEREKIIKCMAQFAKFLQNNAITPINDCYESYLKYLIQREESLSYHADPLNILQLKMLLNEYIETKAMFDKASEIEKKLGKKLVDCSPKEIQKSIEELYKLPYTGKKIKSLVLKQKSARKTEFDKTSEYIHPNSATDWFEKKQKNENQKREFQQNKQTANRKYQDKKEQKTHSGNESKHRSSSLGPLNRNIVVANTTRHHNDNSRYNNRPHHKNDLPPPYHAVPQTHNVQSNNPQPSYNPHNLQSTQGYNYQPQSATHCETGNKPFVEVKVHHMDPSSCSGQCCSHLNAYPSSHYNQQNGPHSDCGTSCSHYRSGFPQFHQGPQPIFQPNYSSQGGFPPQPQNFPPHPQNFPPHPQNFPQQYPNQQSFPTQQPNRHNFKASYNKSHHNQNNQRYQSGNYQKFGEKKYFKGGKKGADGEMNQRKLKNKSSNRKSRCDGSKSNNSSDSDSNDSYVSTN